MPHPEAPPEHKVGCFKRLTKVVEALWQQVPQQDPTARNMFVFYCKAGWRRSYALLIAFLMWSSRIHKPQVWEAIISPIRNERLQKDGPCELLTLVDLNERQRSNGHVALRDCLKDYAAFLVCEFRSHAWPQGLNCLQEGLVWLMLSACVGAPCPKHTTSM